MKENFKTSDQTTTETFKDSNLDIQSLSLEKFKAYTESRKQQFNEARERARELALGPALYVEELLNLMLNEEEKSRFAGFLHEVDLLKKDFTHER